MSKENENIKMTEPMDSEKQLYFLKAEIAKKTRDIQVLSTKLEEQKQKIKDLNETIGSMQNSHSWRITAPVRKTTSLLKLILRGGVIGKTVTSLRRDGAGATWKKIKGVIRPVRQQDELWKRFVYPEKELEAQRKTAFSGALKFSILVPLYNTPEKFLREMIQSALDQTYSNWELCLADGSDEQHGYVETIVMEYADTDPRIRYRKLEKNKGISGNTNACIDMACGDYITLFDHDDILHPAALFEVAKVICEQDADFVYTDEVSFRENIRNCFNHHFKPDYAPDNLRANNYICHLTTMKKSLLDEVGGFDPECDGSQDYDMVLRLTEKAQKIVHIPKVLYYWRAHAGSVAETLDAKPYVFEAAKRSIRKHLQRVGLKGEVLDSKMLSGYRIRYEIKGEPLVSILIPNYEEKTTLETCLNSIFYRSTYRNFEVIIIENNSKSRELFDYYEQIQKKWSNVKVVTWQGKFNYSAINNYGAQFASGEHLLLLNNDTEVITPDWIEELLMYSQREDVGAVGAMLYYPDGTVQHAGVGIGFGGVAGHFFRNFSHDDKGYKGRLCYAQNMSAVTGACMMIRRSVWDEIEGLDEAFEVAFNDVDICLRIRRAGYLIVWTPFAELYHYEFKSRGLDDTPEKKARFRGEALRLQTRWKKEMTDGDPYYNPNLTLNSLNFALKKLD